ncbi:SPOR domain-containing protein [Treponema pallidum]|uniref:Acidic repeat protein n=5 Tax=Treponema pallidum TaxID=160 RepID=E5FNR3_TREPL|nr:SPOR domain-containing protein [Treponema pallidum]ADR64314.1 acidic repeat protein [Treponema pallidum subsp. pallidum]AEZ60757.1 acidic repeat protein [Treponema pallidum subsp. pallidum DAL-1]AGN75627.1 acidic repeat protein [Treponema pallidum subsp. pallidum str. Nichols]ANI43365.1 acidic repeat protein [Treponema pallidum subsp. pallidum]ANI44326.1 acidic repeat protein [Treponema pallidum subsp. pallidum]
MIKRHMFAKRGVKGRSYLVRVNTAFLVLCVASVTPLWAVWEGNAEIGPQGSFLQDGMFVRSDMFPKNTAVEISNLEKNAKAQAVVIGHAGIPGLLVSLAPAAAAQLGIGVYQAVRVRVRTLGTVRGGSQTSQDGLSLASLPSRVPARPAQRDPLSSPPAGHTVPEYRDTVIFDDPRLVSPLSREVEDAPKVVEPASEREGGEREVEDAPKVVEPASEREGGEREVEDVPKVVEPASEREGGEREVEDAPKVVEPASEREGGEREVEDVPKVVEPASEREGGEREVEDVPKVVEPASEREGGEREVEDAPKVVEPASEREGGEREVEDAPKVVEPASEREGGEREVEDVPKVVEPASEREGGEREVEDVPKVVEPASEREGGEREVEDVPKVVEPASEREGGEREVEDVPKVVEPASEREGGEREVEDVPGVVEPASGHEGGEREVEDVPGVVEPASGHEGGEREVASQHTKQPSHSVSNSAPNQFRNPEGELPFTLPDLSESEIVVPEEQKGRAHPQVIPEGAPRGLQPGEYYVQIAVFHDAIQVQSIVHRYGVEYPIAVEQDIHEGKVRFTVCVGPVQKDERGAVLENFQRFGFKDAFLKKAR